MQREPVGHMMRWMVKSTPLQACYQVTCEAHPIQVGTCGIHEIWVVCSKDQQVQSNV